MSDHPSPAEMSAFARGELPLQLSGAVVRHLIGGCEICLAAAPSLFGLQTRPAEPEPDEDAAYDAAIDRAIAAVRRHEREAQLWETRVREIVARLEAGGTDILAKLSRKDLGLPLVEALLARSWAVRHDDPARMVELARLAAVSSRDLDEAKLGAARVADVQCRAWAELANAHRVAEDLEEAAEAFDHAYELCLRGSGDKQLLAHLFDLLASFYRARRDFPRARKALGFVYTLHLQYGQRHFAGRALLSTGILTGYAGEPERAIQLIERGLTLVDEHRDPDLVFAAVHNQLWFLADCGRFEEAQKLVFLNRWRYHDETGGARINQLKLRWLEGRIDAGLDRLAHAEETFREVQAGFEEAELGYQAALASLDLATTLLRRQRPAEARETILRAAEVFRALRVHREAMAAVLFLCETFELGLGTVAILEDAIAFLRRAEHDPGSRYEPLAF